MHLAPSSVRLYTADDPAWDEWLRSARSDVFHTAGYHRYARGSGLGEPFLAVIGDRSRGLAWPYLLRPVDPGHAGAGVPVFDVTSVYGYPGPLAWGCSPGDAFLDEAWERLLDLWRSQGVASVFTRFHPLLDSAALIASLHGPALGDQPAAGVAFVGQTVSIDLTRPLEEIRAGYARGVRGNVDAIRHAGLVTTEDREWHELRTFTALYRDTMRRAGASRSYFFDEADFERLRVAWGDDLHLLVTRSAGAVAAAGLFTTRGDICQWYLAASDERFSTLAPSKLLIEDAAVWAAVRGLRVLHMGGGRGGREDSLFWFKSRFSRVRHPFAIGRWVLDHEAYARLVERRRAGLPAGAELDASFFPLYRAAVVDGGGAVAARR